MANFRETFPNKHAANLAKIKIMKNSLGDKPLAIASGISPEDFAIKKAKLEVEKKKFKELLDDTDARVDKWMKKADELFAFAKDAVEKFNKGGLDDKHYVLSKLGSNFFLFNQQLQVEYRNQGYFILAAHPTTARFSASRPSSPSLLPG